MNETYKIAWLCPTRCRVHSVKKLINSLESTCSNPANFVLYLGVDHDDHDTIEYYTQYHQLKSYVQLIIIPDQKCFPGLPWIWNYMVSQTTESLIGMCGDDFVFMTDKWDEMIVNYWRTNYADNVELIHFDDCLQLRHLTDEDKIKKENLRDVVATNSIVHRDTVNLLDGYLPRYFKHLFCDTWLTHVYALAGRCTFIHNLKIKHEHHSITGDVDDTTRKLKQHCEWNSAYSLFNYKESERVAQADTLKEHIESSGPNTIDSNKRVFTSKTRVFANVMIRDEEILLSHVGKIWKHYPIDKWVFYDDHSSDDTVNTIYRIFGDRAVVLRDKDRKTESYMRYKMLQYSHDTGCSAGVVVSIDVDELLSKSILDDFDNIIDISTKYNFQIYQYNCAGDLYHQRTDPSYINNRRGFLVSLKHANMYEMCKNAQSEKGYHLDRVPSIDLKRLEDDRYGFIHLQALNTTFYFIKQMWYKHYDFVESKMSIDKVNRRYDPVVNRGEFLPEPMPENIIDEQMMKHITPGIYDDVLRSKPHYLKYILSHLDSRLVTFGHDLFLSDVLNPSNVKQLKSSKLQHSV